MTSLRIIKSKIFRFIKRKKIFGLISSIILAILILSLTLMGFEGDAGPFLNRVMVATTPLLLGSLGEIYVERAGVLNLGVEGMMITGAAVGVVGAFAVNSAVVGAVLAALAGALLALIFAVIVTHLRGMQVPAGLGLFMFGLGISGVVGSDYVGLDLPYHFDTIQIPVLSDIPVIGPFLFQHGPIVYIAILLVPIMWFVLFNTEFGTHIRAVGNNPGVADSLGINVYRTRYLCILIGGALAGLAGAFLSLSWSPGWTEGMSAGRGWLVIAIVILALWRPSGALLGSLLIGGMLALQIELQGLGIPVRFLKMTPFITALVALSLILLLTKRLRPPSALLKPYSRE